MWTISSAILSRASAIWLVGLSVVLFGISQGTLMPTVPFRVGQLVPASFRGRIISYLGTFGLVRQFLSPILLSPIASSLGVNYVSLEVGSVSGLLLMLFLVLIQKQGFFKTGGAQADSEMVLT